MYQKFYHLKKEPFRITPDPEFLFLSPSHKQAVATNGSPVFTRGALKRIFKAGKGIPRNLNLLCDNALITGFGYKKKPINTKIVDEVITDFNGKEKPSLMKKVISANLLFLLLFLIACAPVVKNPTPISYTGIQTTYPYTEKEYRLQVGDQLEIKFFYNPELNEQVTVRPDGRISLQLVHELMVAGLTPSELTTSLTQKYAPELKKPEITVIVRSFGAHKVYVDGEVNKSGMFPLMGLMTVMQAISQAGGVKDTARTKEVVIIRRSAENRRLALQVNVQKVINGTDMSQDIALKPFDIVYVPRSPIANVDVWVDQYVRKILPISISTGFGYYPN